MYNQLKFAHMDRRNCIKNLGLLSGGIALSQNLFGKTSLIQKKGKTILLCTGIQYANMGDHGHVTGILNLLTMYLPEVKVILWPKIDLPEFDELIRHIGRKSGSFTRN